MASQSLYRKWRSQTFSDLVGQEQIVQTLKNALASGNLSHAYLFTGPRGTGKTSTARLLAKTLNCTNSKNGEPCNDCEQCREITAGNSFNVIEIDAASNRGIDSIRELREKVMVRPSTGKYKIYILDEAHMLTTEAFNALLKTLEEPPEHAIFVMATTDVHKMLPTVLSRCQRFDFKRITTRQIVAHLQFVAKQEQVELERGAAELIARAAAGGMRDALSLLDQAIAYCGERITLVQVQTMLGVADPRAIQKFVTHVAQLDSAAGLHLIHELAEAGADLRQINTQIAEYWRAVMLFKAGADIATILDSTEDEAREITQTAALFVLDELTDCARIFAQNDLMQKNQGTPQLGLELALLQAIERHRHSPQSHDVQAASPSPAARVSTPGVSSTPAPSMQTPPVSRFAPVQASPVSTPAAPQPKEEPVQHEVVPSEKAAKSEPAMDESDDEGQSQEMGDELPEWDALSYTDDEEMVEDESVIPLTNAQRSDSETALSPTAVSMTLIEPTTDDALQEGAPQVDAPSFTLVEVKEKWEQIKRRVKTKKEGARLVGPLLNDFAVVAVQGTASEAIIIVQAAHPWHYEQIQLKDYYKVVEWALKIELGQECRIKFLSPTQSIPPAAISTFSPSSHNENVSMSAASLPSKMNGLSSRTSEQPATKNPVSRQLGKQQDQHPTNHHSTGYENEVSDVNGTGIPSPLARMHTVRENTTSSLSETSFASDAEASRGVEVVERLETEVGVAMMPTTAPVIVDETRRAVLERKAKADPIVQKVTDMFRANMKEVRPK